MLARIRILLRSLFRRREVEAELDDELAFHLEKKTAEFLAQGLSQEEARRAALRAMNGLEQRKEECRDARGLNWLDDFVRDLGYAARTFRRSPGFTIVVVLSLALGIGANTAIFSVVDALMLRMLPVREPEQLVQIGATAYSDFLRQSLSFEAFPRQAYEAFRDHNDVFTGVMAIAGMDHPEIAVEGQPDEAAEVQLVSGNYFPELGVGSSLGRLIVPEDDRVAAPAPVAVISYGYWQRRFALDPSVTGRRITLNNVSLTVIGVAAPRFFGTTPDRPTDVWVPDALRTQITPASSVNDLVRVIGRLKPGATPEHAAAALDVIYARLPEDQRFNKGNRKTAKIQASFGGHGYSPLREQFAQSLTILMIVVGLVLLTACANVASLLLARATARRTEIRTRLAIGAGRGRIIRQLLTESLLLAVAGGAAGLVIGVWGNHALLALLPERSRPGMLLGGETPLALHFDARILGFTAAVSLLTGVLFGLVPALRATRLSLTQGARGTRSSTESRGGLRLNKLLVVAQVAMSLVLVMAAGLFLRTLDKLRSVDLGFNPQGLVQVNISTMEAGYRGPQVAAVHQLLLDRMAAIPGVKSVSSARNGLIRNGTTATTISVPGLAAPPAREEESVDREDVGPRFCETAGLTLIAGRDFTAADDARSPKVTIINEALARRYFDGRNPLGQRVVTGPEMWEIVGIVRNARNVTLRRDVRPAMYFSAMQRNMNRVSAIQIRTAGDPAGVVAAARQEVLAIDKRLLIDVKTMPQQIDDVLSQERMIGKLSGAFGLLALLLSSGGLYGLMAYSVARRTGEIGVRMALGAQPGNVVRMVLRETAALVLAGVAIGLPVTYAATRFAGHWIEGLLFEMKATDATTLVLASLTLGVVALLAGVVPARRASRLDPMVALRCE